MKFELAFPTISSCSPSRSSLITARYPHNTDAEELHWPLPAEQTTFVELLKNAGYWTASAGKWHIGNEVRDRFDLVREADTSGFQLPTGAAGQTGKFVETSSGDARSGCSDWVDVLKTRPGKNRFFYGSQHSIRIGLTTKQFKMNHAGLKTFACHRTIPILRKSAAITPATTTICRIHRRPTQCVVPRIAKCCGYALPAA